MYRYVLLLIGIVFRYGRLDRRTSYIYRCHRNSSIGGDWILCRAIQNQDMCHTDLRVLERCKHKVPILAWAAVGVAAVAAAGLVLARFFSLTAVSARSSSAAPARSSWSWLWWY